MRRKGSDSIIPMEVDEPAYQDLINSMTLEEIQSFLIAACGMKINNLNTGAVSSCFKRFSSLFKKTDLCMMSSETVFDFMTTLVLLSSASITERSVKVRAQLLPNFI